MPWLLDLAQQKSWWDTVDSLVKVVGKIVRRSGTKGKRAMDRAVKHDELLGAAHRDAAPAWLREPSVDTERLFRYAELLAAEKEFFIRKAIGWALRDYAWHDWRAMEKFLNCKRREVCRAHGARSGKNLAALRKTG